MQIAVSPEKLNFFCILHANMHDPYKYSDINTIVLGTSEVFHVCIFPVYFAVLRFFISLVVQKIIAIFLWIRVKSSFLAQKQPRCTDIEWSLRAFASTSSRQIFLASSEHSGELQMASGEQRALRVLHKFFASWNLSFISRIRCFAPSNG